MNEGRLAVRTPASQWTIDQQIQLARTGFSPNADRPQITDGR